MDIKKTIKTILCVCLFAILSGFSAINIYELKNNSAEVNQYQGVYIFTDSKPLKDYKYLGTVKSTLIFDSQYRIRLVSNSG